MLDLSRCLSIISCTRISPPTPQHLPPSVCYSSNMMRSLLCFALLAGGAAADKFEFNWKLSGAIRTKCFTGKTITRVLHASRIGKTETSLTRMERRPPFAENTTNNFHAKTHAARLPMCDWFSLIFTVVSGDATSVFNNVTEGDEFVQLALPGWGLINYK